MLSLTLITLLAAAPDRAASATTATRALTLADAVTLALASDPRVGRAAIGRDRAALATLRAQLDRFSVTADAALEELWTASSAGGSLGLGLSNLSAGASVPIFSGFRVESNVARAEHLERAAQYDADEERRATVLSVARAYWTVRRHALLRAVEAEALAQVSAAEMIARARVASGLAPPIDERRVVARRISAAAVLADLAGQQREAEAQLAVLLGVDGPLALVDAPQTGAPENATADELVARAFAHRAALAAAAARLDAQDAAIAMARAGYYPTLAAYARVQVGNNPFLAGAGSRAVPASANPFAGVEADVQLGAALSINLFDTLHTRHAVEDAEYQARVLSREAEDLRRTVAAEVRAAHARLSRLRALADTLTPLAEVTRDNVTLLQHRYESGDAAIFELLDAELERVDVARRRTTTDAELTVATIELDAALGNLSTGDQR